MLTRSSGAYILVLYLFFLIIFLLTDLLMFILTNEILLYFMHVLTPIFFYCLKRHLWSISIFINKPSNYPTSLFPQCVWASERAMREMRRWCSRMSGLVWVVLVCSWTWRIAAAQAPQPPKTDPLEGKLYYYIDLTRFFDVSFFFCFVIKTL